MAGKNAPIDVIADIVPGSAMTASLVSGSSGQGLGQPHETMLGDLVNSTSSNSAQDNGEPRQKSSTGSLFTQASNGVNVGANGHHHQSNPAITPPGVAELGLVTPTTPLGGTAGGAFDPFDTATSRSNSSHASSTSSRLSNGLSTGFNSLPSHSRQGSADSCPTTANAAR